MNHNIAVALKNKTEHNSNFSVHNGFSKSKLLQEYRALLDDFPITLGIASSPKEYQAIYNLRQTVYEQDNMAYLLNPASNFHPAADTLDNSSYLFYCRSGNNFLATCRYSPAIDGQWESPEITRLASLVPTDTTRLLQIGRLVIQPEHRSRLLAELLIWACSDWLRRHTLHTFFYAICTPALSRFYRHFGAKTVPNSIVKLPERQNKTYRVVYGSMDTVATTLDTYTTQRGWSLDYPHQTDLSYPQVS